MSTLLPEVAERVTEGSGDPRRWLHAPSSLGMGRSEGKVVSVCGSESVVVCEMERIHARAMVEILDRATKSWELAN